MLVYMRGTTGIMFCYQTDWHKTGGAYKREGGGITGIFFA